MVSGIAGRKRGLSGTYDNGSRSKGSERNLLRLVAKLSRLAVLSR